MSALFSDETTDLSKKRGPPGKHYIKKRGPSFDDKCRERKRNGGETILGRVKSLPLKIFILTSLRGVFRILSNIYDGTFSRK